MPPIDRRFHVELAARNFELAFGTNPARVISWDPGAWRGPRVLVPIAVEALVVPPTGAGTPAAPRAAVAVDPLDASVARPAPFDETAPLAPGVHLHWALPDGLTRGVAPSAPADAPLPAGATAAAELPEPRSTERARYRPIPDRWLVARVAAGATATAPRVVSAWVIESALDPSARRVTPLARWREDRTDAAAPELTALGPGDPTFAAYYDNTREVLGFHDALGDVAQGPLTYLVSGWYSEPSRDPLHAPRTEAAWYAELAALGWALPDGSTQRLDEAARAQAGALAQLGLTGGGAPAPDGAAPRAAAVSAPQVNLADVVLGEGAAKFVRTMGGVGAQLARLFQARQRYFEQHWPRQILCHGAVVDVRWNGRGGGFDVPEAGVPSAGSVSVAVGNTGAQALAALVAAREREPGLERTLAAFHHGALPELALDSGIARLESVLHAEDFEVRPGGFVLAEIEQGDLFPPASGSENSPRPPVPGRRDELVTTVITQHARFFRDSRDMASLIDGIRVDGLRTAGPRADELLRERFGAVPPLAGGAAAAAAAAAATGAAGGSGAGASAAGPSPAGSPRRTETVRRPMPRWYEPRDPVLLLSEAKRSYKHGEDGALDPLGLLPCRLTGDTIAGIGVRGWLDPAGRVSADAPLLDIRGDDLTTTDFTSGQVPAECGALLYETLLLDPTVVPVASAVIVQKARAAARADRRTKRVIVPPSVAGRHFAVEQGLLLAPALEPGLDVQALAALSNASGTMPSMHALRLWRRPWTPVEASWEVEWHPSPDGVRDWQLGETDFSLRPGAPAVDPAAPALILSGRTLLTPSAADTMRRRLEQFLEDESRGTQDDATPAQEADLAQVAADVARLDVLATSLGGLHLALRGRGGIPGLDAVPDPHGSQPAGAGDGLTLLRAGHLRLRRVRLIDAFGQVHDIGAARLAAPIVAEDLRSPAGQGLLALPPRTTEPARLMFRLLDAADDTREATRNRSPVCGWLVPDHLDGALEVMDGAGQSLGQLQPAEDGRLLEWQGVPGQQAPLGAPPAIAQPQLAGMVNGLLALGRRDPRLLASDTPPSEPVLSALLRMIDATLWTNDPIGRAGNEHLSVVIGHPLALVRVELRLEVESTPDPRDRYMTARAELERTPIPVRLGELLALDDGLMGYFVNDDFSRFHPVHEALADQARASGPGRGFLGSAATTTSLAAEPVRHPYIDRAPFVEIRPGQRLLLTLLVDPRGAVHVTSGIVPRKKIELMREHVAPALDAMALTFRVGPVLVDPEQIRMPLPAEIRGGWSWVRKVNVTAWAEDPVVKATQDALLPDAPAEITEGWLRVSGALKAEG